MEQTSSDAMAARFVLPVLNVLFLFFTGRGDSFLSQRRERKEWGRKAGGQSRPPLQDVHRKPEERADEGIGPYDSIEERRDFISAFLSTGRCGLWKRILLKAVERMFHSSPCVQPFWLSKTGCGEICLENSGEIRLFHINSYY